MSLKQAALAGAIALLLGACQSSQPPAASTGAAAKGKATAADADRFVAELDTARRARYAEISAASWVSQTYINQDSQLLVAKTNERDLAQTKQEIEQAKAYEAAATAPATKRQILLLKLSPTLPAPRDPKALSEMTTLAAKLDGGYGAAKYCKDERDPAGCRDLGALEKVLETSRDYDEQLDAWRGWHDTAKPARASYQRLVTLVNDGSRDLGYKDTGEFWRAGYDMTPAEFQTETDRLWGQVKPLYDQLQCYTRRKLVDKYGDKGSIDGKIPAHLTGNMWAQAWSNIYDGILQPYPKASALDVTGALEAEREAIHKKLVASEKNPLTPDRLAALERQADLDYAKATVHRTEDFYRSIGFPALPASYYERSQFVKPMDRDVVCHASAWDLDLKGDLRIKMCIRAVEEDFRTVYHEMGHNYYYLSYENLPLLFQNGAHDGFHEAIGDTITLSLTPGYLHQIGLVGEAQESNEALVNKQMKLALDKIAFLPFALLVDRWRWGVFSGEIKPEDYNKAWWKLRAQYQGVAPAVERGEDAFDPGAKYHVPGNVPYTRYFLADILQFQFHRALCQAAGHQGPLASCSIYGNKEAGAKYWAMLQKGQSQPWPATLKQLTGSEQMDASAILDYFAPLNDWLKKENEGQQCGWSG